MLKFINGCAMLCIGDEYMVEIERLQQHLKLIRRTVGWTIEEFAEKIGVTKQTIINFESNRSKITKTTYIAIRAVLNAEMEKNPEECKMLYDILDIFVDHPEDYSEELRKVLLSKANIITPATMTKDVSREEVSREWRDIILAISAGIGSFAFGYALGVTNPNLLKRTIEKLDISSWTKIFMR